MTLSQGGARYARLPSAKFISRLRREPSTSNEFVAIEKRRSLWSWRKNSIRRLLRRLLFCLLTSFQGLDTAKEECRVHAAARSDNRPAVVRLVFKTPDFLSPLQRAFYAEF